MSKAPAATSAVLLRSAGQYGLTRDRLRGVNWERLSRGLYARRAPDRSPAELARALVEVLPRDSGFGHLTGALLRGWPMPNQLGSHVVLATAGMIIRDAEDARGRPRDPRRLRTWWRHAKPSTVTPYGRTLLAARLQRYRLAAERRRAA
jgi:hypothetical protein